MINVIAALHILVVWCCRAHEIKVVATNPLSTLEISCYIYVLPMANVESGELTASYTPQLEVMFNTGECSVVCVLLLTQADWC